MSVGNYGAIRNALEQMVQQAFLLTGTDGNQGLAIAPYLLDRVLTRPDFVNTLNAKVYFPTLNGASGQDVAATATNPVAVFWENNHATTAYIVIFGIVKASVTLGTTDPSHVIVAKANSSGVEIFAQPLSLVTNTGLSWDSTTNIYAGATRSTAAKVQVAMVYTA